MTPEQRYCFDTAGFLVVPAALGPQEVQRARGGDLSFLSAHPSSKVYLDTLSSEDAALVEPVRELDPAASLRGGYDPRNISAGFVWPPSERRCNRLQLLWALDGQTAGSGADCADESQPDDGGWIVYPASHLSNCLAPAAVLAGGPSAHRRRPALRPGDLIVCAGGLLCGLLPIGSDTPPRFVTAEYSAAGSPSPGATKTNTSVWALNLVISVLNLTGFP